MKRLSAQELNAVLDGIDGRRPTEPERLDEVWTISPSGEEANQVVDILIEAGDYDVVLVMPIRMHKKGMLVKEVILPATPAGEVTLGIYSLSDPFPRELLNGPNHNYLTMDLIAGSEKRAYHYLDGTNSSIMFTYTPEIELLPDQYYFLAITGETLFHVPSRVSDATNAFMSLSNLVQSYSTIPRAVEGKLPYRLQTVAAWSMPVAVLRSQQGMVLYGAHRP